MNLKKLESYLRVNLLGPGPSSYKTIIYGAAVSQRLGNTAIDNTLEIAVYVYFILYDMVYIFYRSWVDTRWQQYITHLHTNSTEQHSSFCYISYRRSICAPFVILQISR
jgi:hypothetical protein